MEVGSSGVTAAEAQGWRSLVLRVKRKRTEAAGEEVIVLEGTPEDSAPRKRRGGVGEKGTLQDAFEGLSGPSVAAVTQTSRRLYLRRVQTLAADGGRLKRSVDDVDVDTLGTFRQHSLAAISASSLQEHHGEATSGNAPAAARWVTGSKKRLRVDGDGDGTIVVVDVEVRSTGAALALERKRQTQPAPNPRQPTRGIRILDPASRALESAIEGTFSAVPGASGRLADCMAAIEKGADVNLQTLRHGLTVLMAAAFHGDSRLVSRLLAKGANASLLTYSSQSTGSSGQDSHDLKKAIDFAEDPDYFGPHSNAKPSALRETIMLLQIAEQKGSSLAYHDAQLRPEVSDDYVMDVYCVVQQEAGASSEPPHRVVNIPGLRFNVDEASGNIKDFDFTETTFAYDSDWSDLGDDEDPDSNDERFGGNDYPEEEEGDDSEVCDSDSECAQYRQRGIICGGRTKGVDSGDSGAEEWEDVSADSEDGRDLHACEDFDFELDGSSVDSETGRQPRQVHFQLAPVDTHGATTQLSDCVSKGPEWDRMQLVQQQAAAMNALPPLRNQANRVGTKDESDRIDYLNTAGGRDASRALRSSGKVLRPFTREDPFQPIPKKKGALKQLWDGLSSTGPAVEGDQGCADEDIAALRGYDSGACGMEKKERLEQMDERLGLVPFDSNANEFDASGLPKYGPDLSDDEVDLQYLRSAYNSDITWAGDGTVIVPIDARHSVAILASQTHNMHAYDSSSDQSSNAEN